MADNSDMLEVLRRLVSAELDTVNTALPCTVVSYNNGRVTVKPDGEKVYADGDSNPYPVLTDLRFCWPQFANGQAGVKGPVMSGDKCMLIVCQHATDDSGDMRRFDLIDAYVIPGAGYMDDVPGNDDMRLYYKNAFIAFDENGKLTINAPGGIEEITTEHKINATLYAKDVVIDGIKSSTHRHKQSDGGITDGPMS